MRDLIYQDANYSIHIVNDEYYEVINNRINQPFDVFNTDSIIVKVKYFDEAKQIVDLLNKLAI
jgi:hypothetical protein